MSNALLDSDKAKQTASVVHTYHCLCTNLLLATTYNLSTLPRRSAASKDRALILPCPSHAAADSPSDLTTAAAEAAVDGSTGYTMLVSVSTSSPIMIAREDGFEKRWLLRCGRCRLVLGYHLDWSQFEAEQDDNKSGERRNVLYLLPGATLTTEDMKAGKKPTEGAVSFGISA